MTYQQVIIVGNVGRDPELRYTPQGVAVTDFSVAVSERWTDQNGQKQERTTWWRVTCWRRLAETVAQYVSKGRQVMIVARRVEASAYTNRNGDPQASLEVTADDVRFLSGTEPGGGSGSGGSNSNVAGGDFPQDNDFAPPADDINDIPF